MKTAIELIAKERQEQIDKHGRTVAFDKKINKKGQLIAAACALAIHESVKGQKAIENYCCPDGWNQAIWSKMVNKPYKERLIIAASLIAAHIDTMD